MSFMGPRGVQWHLAMAFFMAFSLLAVGCAEPEPGESAPTIDAALVDGAMAMEDATSPMVDAGIDGQDAASIDAMTEPDMEPVVPDGVHCFDGPLEVAEEGAGFGVIGPHYHLYIEETRDRAEEVGRMLEAAWPAYEEYFGYAPVLEDDGARLSVKFYENVDGWRAGMEADGIDASGIQAGGYFYTGTRTAYLYRQPTLFYTDALVLHEAVHQFQHLGRAGDNNLLGWYVEGVAEHLSRHHWDGRCVQIGIRPLLSREDVPAKALEDIETEGMDLGAIIEGSTGASRPVLWAIYSFLQTGEDDLTARFEAFRTVLDGGGETEHLELFEELVADPAMLEEPLLAWLRDAQLPMRDIYLEWTHIGPHSVRGHGANFSYALFKAPLSGLSYRAIPNSESWGLGVIMEHFDNQNFTGLVLFSSGEVSTFEVIEGAATWWGQGSVPLGPDTRTVRVELTRSDEMAMVRFDDNPFTFATSHPPTLGLVINDSDVLFEDLLWQVME